MSDQNTSEVGAVGSWVCIILASVTAQDLAYYLASVVSLGAILINFDRYVASVKRQWRKIKGEDE